MIKLNSLYHKSFKSIHNITQIQKQVQQRNQFFIKRRFSKQEQPKSDQPKYEFNENPIIFNKINENYVIKGKERVVGLWLLSVSLSIFGMITLGGYTRLSKSGLSMTKWQLLTLKPPRTEKEWKKEFKRYQKYPEYYKINKQKGMDLEGFKTIYYIEWGHRILGRSIGIIFFVPMLYFMARGYIQKRLRVTLLSLLLLGGLQGAIGWWMVKSGLVDKDKTKELDKTPRVSPYRLTVHAGFAYFLYGVCLWQSLHLLRKPQEAVININNMHIHNGLRKVLARFAHSPLFPLTILFGFFTAGIQGRHACNTFPWVGDHYFFTKNHFQDDIPFWKNFTENKLVVQVTHRTLALLFVAVSLFQIRNQLQKKLLTRAARNSLYLISFAMILQVLIGIHAVWYPQPHWLGVSHQAGALFLISSIVYGMHCCRRVDPRHIKNLLGKLKREDPKGYRRMMENFNSQLNTKEGQALKQFLDKTK